MNVVGSNINTTANNDNNKSKSKNSNLAQKLLQTTTRKDQRQINEHSDDAMIYL